MNELFPLLLVCLLGVFLACSLLALPRYRLWRTRKQRMDELDARYEELRKMRRELIYHVDWARERGDRQVALGLEPEVDRVDEELQAVKKLYEDLEKEGKPPSKSL